jgi:hypothetical protein
MYHGSTAKSLSQSTSYNYSNYTSYFQLSSSNSQYFDNSFVEFKNMRHHFIVSYFGISDIHNTENAWGDINSDGTPTSEEIDYSKIDTFNFEELGISFPLRFLKGDYKVWQNLLFSNLHDSHSFHISFMLEKQIYLNNVDIKISLHDVVSLKRWSTDSWEFFYPSIQLNTVYSLSKVKLYGEIIKHPYHHEFGVGMKFDLHEKLSLLGGYSSNNSQSYGISIKDKHVSVDMAFIPFQFQNPFLPEHELTIIFNVDSFFKTIKSLSP